jgi:uncharacterized protein Yka (UPF0111/DUF47 family)
MGMLRTTVADAELHALLAASGDNLQRTALLLRELLETYPERAGLAADIRDLEHEGDRLAHDVIHRLTLTDTGASGGRGWIPPADGLALATALDDVVDYAEEAADRLGLYGIEAPMEQASALADVLVGATEQVAGALRGLAADEDLAPWLVEIHRLENEGDRISREALGSLFANGIDPMVVIRWKDVFDALECSVDSCERVAHVLEGITLKRR